MALSAALLFEPGRVGEKDGEVGEALIVTRPVHVRSERRLPWAVALPLRRQELDW